MDININVSGQYLTLATDFNKAIIEDSQNFVHFIFDFSSDWDGLTVFAQFIQDGVAYNVYVDENNSASLPPEIEPGVFYLVIYGASGEGSNSIATSSSFLKFRVTESKFISDGESVEITETLYQQMVDAVADYKDDILALLGDLSTVLDSINGEVI